MSRLASAADYKREIASVEALLAQEIATSERLGDDFASQVTRASLESRLASLRAELAALSDEGLPGHELDVLLTGEPVVGETVDASFLGHILQNIQALVHALVNAQFGRLAHHGSWPEEVLRRSTLRVAETFPGSFGVKLETLDDQLELEGHLAIQPAFQDLFEVVTSGKEGAAFLEELGPMGPRARSHLRTLMKSISSAEAGIELRWPLIEGEKRAVIDARRAKQLADVLDRIDEADRLEERIGLLEGAILRTRFFELQEDDGTVVSGRVSADIQEDIPEYFGHRVKATLLITTVRDRGTSVEKETYRLMRLALAEG